MRSDLNEFIVMARQAATAVRRADIHPRSALLSRRGDIRGKDPYALCTVRCTAMPCNEKQHESRLVPPGSGHA